MKPSSYIQLPQAVAFIEAASKAFIYDTPWNCHITLHLTKAGILPNNASKHVIDSIHKLNKYHKRNGMGVCYGWVLENSPFNGTHLHLLLHRPYELPMHHMTYRWAVLKRFQLPNKIGVLKVEKFRTMQSYERNITELLSYVLKGIRPGMKERLEAQTGIRVRKSDGEGIIYGKRIGWSR